MGGNMRLRNKKTGEIKEWQKVGAIDYGEMNEVYDAAEYNSLAELNEEWEDYKPAEPYIKDAKVRELLTMWAELCKINKVKYYQAYDGTSSFIYEDKEGNEFLLDFAFPIDNLCVGAIYGITELCG